MIVNIKMKFCIFIIPIIFYGLNLYGWEDIKTRITVTSKNGYSSDKLIFGLNSKATESLDTALGELEAPPIGPPSGISPVFYIYDTNQKTNIYTWMDLRPYPETDTSTIEYIIEVFKATDDILTFSWKPLWPEIDKAILMDTLPNHMYAYVNMKDSTQATISNNYIHTFKLLVNYKNQSEIIEKKINTGENYIKIYPVVFNNKIIVESSNIFEKYKIVNTIGFEVLSGEIISGNEEIKTESLANGIYFILCYDIKGNMNIQKVIKI